MSTVTKSFTTTDSSSSLFVKKNSLITYSVSGTFVATVLLEVSEDNAQSWAELKRFSAGATGSISTLNKDCIYRLRCLSRVSGTVVTSISEVGTAKDSKRIFNAAGRAKVGATSGFVVAAADDVALATCPASQTASTLVIPVGPFANTNVIKGFHLIGQIESAGGIATVDCVLKKHNAVAADVTTTTVATMTQISVTADAAITSANSFKDGFTLPVADDETYFFLITVTTAAATDVALQGVALIIEG